MGAGKSKPHDSRASKAEPSAKEVKEPMATPPDDPPPADTPPADTPPAPVESKPPAPDPPAPAAPEAKAPETPAAPTAPVETAPVENSTPVEPITAETPTVVEDLVFESPQAAADAAPVKTTPVADPSAVVPGKEYTRCVFCTFDYHPACSSCPRCTVRENTDLKPSPPVPHSTPLEPPTSPSKENTRCTSCTFDFLSSCAACPRCANPSNKSSQVLVAAAPPIKCPRCTVCTGEYLPSCLECPRCGSDVPRKPIVGGNWKCNPESTDAISGLIDNLNACDTSKCEVYVCPTFFNITMLSGKLTNATNICAQNCNFKGCGAYTGEVAAEQLLDLGVKWVLLGHSERRELFGESDDLLATKLKYCLDKGMNVVFAIGEKKEERESGQTMEVCIRQLSAVKSLLDPRRVVIAYEPVWAIGTGLVATPEQAQQAHADIRAWIKDSVSARAAKGMRIQYGGSANGKNAPDLSKQPDIDGFLVGGASLKPEFASIVAAISEVKGRA